MPTEPNMRKRVSLSLVAAVAKFHAAGHFHRDIKPANICFTNNGVVTLIDVYSGGQIDNLDADLRTTEATTPVYDIQRLHECYPDCKVSSSESEVSDSHYCARHDLYSTIVVLAEINGADYIKNVLLSIIHDNKTLSAHPRLKNISSETDVVRVFYNFADIFARKYSSNYPTDVSDHRKRSAYVMRAFKSKFRNKIRSADIKNDTVIPYNHYEQLVKNMKKQRPVERPVERPVVYLEESNEDEDKLANPASKASKDNPRGLTIAEFDELLVHEFEELREPSAVPGASSQTNDNQTATEESTTVVGVGESAGSTAAHVSSLPNRGVQGLFDYPNQPPSQTRTDIGLEQQSAASGASVTKAPPSTP